MRRPYLFEKAQTAEKGKSRHSHRYGRTERKLRGCREGFCGADKRLCNALPLIYKTLPRGRKNAWKSKLILTELV